jgi:hypothetical protein
MRARRKRVQPPPQKGRRWQNRTEALKNAVTRRALENRRTPRKVPVQFQRKQRPSPWRIAKLRLQGKTTLEIASQFAVRQVQKHSALHQHVEAVCRSLELVGQPARYWRGQVITSQHLRDARSDFRTTLKHIAATMGVRPNRLETALGGKIRPLSVTLADSFLVARERLSKKHQRSAPTSKGGHVPLLRPSEKRAIAWQKRILPKEIRNLGEDVSKLGTPKTLGDAMRKRSRATSSGEDMLGGSLCKLKRQRKVSTLFLWALDFLPWLMARYGPALNILIEKPGWIAREFLAAEYGHHKL